MTDKRTEGIDRAIDTLLPLRDSGSLTETERAALIVALQVLQAERAHILTVCALLARSGV